MPLLTALAAAVLALGSALGAATVHPTVPASPAGVMHALVPTSAQRRGDLPARAVWPLDPRPPVVRGFDPPDTPWGAGNRGVDLLGRPDQTVRAAAAGRVSFVGTIAGVGVVAVDHGAVRTTYEPVRASVTTGQRVAVGEPIGVLVTRGSHCLPRTCLHWGLIRNADHVYLDPLLLVGAGPVRLLPLHGEPSG